MTDYAKNHTMFPWDKISREIKLNGKFLMNVFQLFLILITDFTIFIVPNKTIRWHFASVSLMFTIPFFLFFRKSYVTSPVAPKTIGSISNDKLEHNRFNSDDNCM